MPKTLVVCCDGTWDKPVERHGTHMTSTNVYKLWRGLADSDQEGSAQRTFYHEGLGTGGLLDRIFGGAFGAGLAHNVCECYRFLVLNYEPGDRIYLFGFSRGAYTARSVAGMVRNCGILKPENFDRNSEAFELYRDRGSDTSPSSERAKAFRQQYGQTVIVGGAASHDIPLHFIGVWDTVGSMGVPVPIPFWRPWWAFHDSDLSSTVANAYHALAIDEARGPFKPTLWTRNRAPAGQVLEQVWFAGCHRDVGGGEPDPDLADITLTWMATRAHSCGLAFEPDHFIYAATSDELERYQGLRVHPDAAGHLHQSRRGFFWKGLVWRHRRALPTGNSRPGYELSEQSVGSTAVERADMACEGYPPRQLKDYLENGGPVVDVSTVEQAHEMV